MKGVKTALWVLAIVVFLYVSYKLVPPYFDNWRFEDVIASEARMNTYSYKSEEEIRDLIYKKAQNLEIPIKPEQIQVRRYASELTIDAEYTVHVDLLLHPMDLTFRPSSRNKRI
jgi:hypothetical protein